MASPLTVLITSPQGLGDARRAVDALLPSIVAVGGDIVVVGPDSWSRDDERVSWVGVADRSTFLMRHRGVARAGGAVIAFGEDHAVPRDGWCEGVLRAHEAHPAIPMVVGALANATTATYAGRANFLAFAAPWSHPIITPATHRPAPISAMSVKRIALDGMIAKAGDLERHLAKIFMDGCVVTEPSLIVDHYQDHGIPWSMANAFHAARAGFGFANASKPLARRARAAVGAMQNPRRHVREARACPGATTADVVAVVPIALASGFGAVVGTLVGPGQSEDHLS